MKTIPYFWIYMLECDDGSFYTGYTTNLVRRFRQHVEGSANVRYTRSHRPLKIAQCWRIYEPIGYALKVEKLIKTGGRKAKEKLVREPSRLKTIAASKLGCRVRVYAFEPTDVERAAQGIAVDELRDMPDPFVSVPPGGGRENAGNV